MRRQPRSSTATASSERISYRGIVLRNIATCLFRLSPGRPWDGPMRPWDRPARLLTEVVHAPGAVTFTELAAATGLAKSTTSRLLLALERNGLVRRDDAGRFRPGEIFVRFAWRGGAEAGLTEVAQPYLDRLGEATGETVNLGVGRDGMVEQIAQVDSVYLIGATNWLGRAAALQGDRQGAARPRRGQAASGPAGAAHRPEHHQPGGAGGRACHRSR